MWFGALFGLGSAAIRVSLLEELIVACGIDLIVPAAAPPLGVTARILMALLMASFGSLIGYALGTRIARPRIEPVQRRRATLAAEEPPLPRRSDHFTTGEAAAPRPLSAFEELGAEDRIASTSNAPATSLHSLGSRRRALTMAEPDGPDYGRDHAPLPGSEILAPVTPDAEASDVLDLSDALFEAYPVEATLHDDEHLDSIPRLAPEALTPGAAPRPFDRGSDGPVPASRAASTNFGTPGHDDEAAEPADDRVLPPRNIGKPFAAPPPANEAGGAPSPHSGAEAAVVPPAPIEPIETAAQGSAAHAAPLWGAATPQARSGSAADHLLSAPLDSLSQIELIERLALSMKERRAAAAVRQATPPPATPAAPAAESFAFQSAGDMPRFGFEPRTPVEIDLPAPSAPIALEPVLPAAMRPLDLAGDIDEDTAEATPALPRFPFAAPQGGAITYPPTPGALATSTGADPGETDADDSGEDSLADESFSSLLDLGRAPLRQPLVRIEEPADETAEVEPVVVFPGHGSRPFAAPAPATAMPEPAPPPVPPGARPFDAPTAVPTAAAQPQPATSRQDPEETERALRAALATLQRMSGAA